MPAEPPKEISLAAFLCASGCNNGMRSLRTKVGFFLTINIFTLFFLGYSTAVFAGDVFLSWNANTEPDLAGYKVRYGTASGSYGTIINIGDQTTYTVTGLGFGTYYFAVTAYDTSGNESGFSNEVSKMITDPGTSDSTGPAESVSTVLPDILPPTDVTDFQAVSGDRQVKLTWTNPPDSDFMGVRIRFRMDGSFPTNAQDGELVGDFMGPPLASDTHVHKDLYNGSTYYYAAFTYDTSGNYSQTIYASATPLSSQSADQADSQYEIEGGFGCGTVKNIGPPKNPPAWPLDLFLLGALLLWFSLRNTQRMTCPAKEWTMG
jgi:hypothetical protein